ncbi:unnamed protein product [Amoebophrya sp. A120]|nr:unnamed protein product [Amoebophrya sp. A120]|eukprot:GSA120T00016716001.1
MIDEDKAKLQRESGSGSGSMLEEVDDNANGFVDTKNLPQQDSLVDEEQRTDHDVASSSSSLLPTSTTRQIDALEQFGLDLQENLEELVGHQFVRWEFVNPAHFSSGDDGGTKADTVPGFMQRMYGGGEDGRDRAACTSSAASRRLVEKRNALLNELYPDSSFEKQEGILPEGVEMGTARKHSLLEKDNANLSKQGPSAQPAGDTKNEAEGAATTTSRPPTAQHTDQAQRNNIEKVVPHQPEEPPPIPVRRRLVSTPLGDATAFSSMETKVSKMLYEELHHARENGFSLDPIFHCLYLCTPTDRATLLEVLRQIDWSIFLKLIRKSDGDEKMVMKDVKVSQDFVELQIKLPAQDPEANDQNRQLVSKFIDEDRYPIQVDAQVHTGVLLQGSSFAGSPTNLCSGGPALKRDGKYVLQLIRHLRYFCAMILYSLVSEATLTDTMARFKVDRSIVQQLQNNAGMYCGTVVQFCDRMRWWVLWRTFESLGPRMQFAAPPELQPLCELGITAPRARKLHEANWSVEKIAKVQVVPDVYDPETGALVTNPLLMEKNKLERWFLQQEPFDRQQNGTVQRMIHAQVREMIANAQYRMSAMEQKLCDEVLDETSSSDSNPEKGVAR